VVLAPPWGGPEYLDAEDFHLSAIKLGGITGEDLFRIARTVTSNIAYFLPRNALLDELGSLVPSSEGCEVEDQFLNGKLKTRVAYFGSIAHGVETPCGDGGGGERERRVEEVPSATVGRSSSAATVGQ